MFELQLVFLSAGHIPKWGGKNPKGTVKLNCDVFWVKDREPNHEFMAKDEFKGGNSVLATLKPEHEQSKARAEQSKKFCEESVCP